MDAAQDLSHKTLVCVIDGSDRHRDIIAQALDPFYTVAAYADSEEALDWLRQTQPALIILDEETKPLGGPSMLEAILRISSQDKPPIVCTSMKADSEFFERAKKRGVAALLTKPFKRSDIIRTISNLVNAKIESKWTDLDQLIRDALYLSSEFFDGLSDLVGSDEVLDVAKAHDACGKIVTAVNAGGAAELLGAIQGHNNYIFMHSIRMATHLAMFGGAIGLKGENLLSLTAGGLLHDIGKVEIPFTILNKPGELSFDDMRLMKSHVERTLSLMSRCNGMPKGAIQVAALHHEKLDGTGYPRGLKGPEINKLARISTIADVYCAMTDSRPYKRPLSSEEALDKMSQMTDWIDPQLLKGFRQFVLDGLRV
jgi:HD-GYP domain-containing protein (c-di-GMP phosphodiesterase class II)